MTLTKNISTKTPKSTKSPSEKKATPDKIEIASDDSFPCSDPPGWIKVHVTTDSDKGEWDEKSGYEKNKRNVP